MLSGNADCHTSDIGHWFAMTKTDFVYGLKRSSFRCSVLFLSLRCRADQILYFSA